MLSFLAYLLFLETIMIMWFVLIMRVAMRVLSGKTAEDVRSDSEASEEELSSDNESNTDEEVVGIRWEGSRPFEEEVGVEDLDLTGGRRSTSVKRSAALSATGVSRSGHSAAKELLNRIGCEKQIE
jgi:acyl-CoA-dependent ceramide synthase